MTYRKLSEPKRAMNDVLAGLVTQTQRMQNRQRWQGAIQATDTEGVGAAMSNLAIATLSSIDLEPGAWFVMGRAGVQVSSTPGVPTYTGTELFRVSMNALRRDTTELLEVLDSDYWSPASLQDAWTGGFYADSTVLFGQFTAEAQTTVVITGAADETSAADHVVPWRAGKLIALPF